MSILPKNETFFRMPSAISECSFDEVPLPFSNDQGQYSISILRSQSDGTVPYDHVVDDAPFVQNLEEPPYHAYSTIKPFHTSGHCDIQDKAKRDTYNFQIGLMNCLEAKKQSTLE